MPRIPVTTKKSASSELTPIGIGGKMHPRYSEKIQVHPASIKRDTEKRRDVNHKVTDIGDFRG